MACHNAKIAAFYISLCFRLTKRTESVAVKAEWKRVDIEFSHNMLTLSIEVRPVRTFYLVALENARR